MPCVEAIQSGCVAERHRILYPAVFQIDPLQDVRWGRLVATHPNASVFHSRAWLEALRQTYGYEPVVYTTTPVGLELKNGIVFCRVKSWLTGSRLVSVPFADHCHPLVDTNEDLSAIGASVEESLSREGWRYAELRSFGSGPLLAALPGETAAYHFHELDLRPDLETLFHNFHKNSTQRKIRRADREGLRCETGVSESLLNSFYWLLKITRRRHKLPPQPIDWFRNLIRCFGDALTIRIAFKNDQPIAGMLTLSSKASLVYKYGCSDTRFRSMGAMHLLFWRAIQDAKERGIERFDLGRMNIDQPSLAVFKERWGAIRSTLTYTRYSLEPKPTHILDLNPSRPQQRTIRNVLELILQSRIASIVGQLLYRHAG